MFVGEIYEPCGAVGRVGRTILDHLVGSEEPSRTRSLTATASPIRRIGAPRLELLAGV